MTKHLALHPHTVLSRADGDAFRPQRTVFCL